MNENTRIMTSTILIQTDDIKELVAQLFTLEGNWDINHWDSGYDPDDGELRLVISHAK